jgi:hypothetical protein
MGTRTGGTLVVVFMAALFMPLGSASAQTSDPSPNEATAPADGTGTGSAQDQTGSARDETGSAQDETGSAQEEPPDARRAAQTPEGGQGRGALLRIFGGQLNYRNEFFYELGNEGPSGSLFNPYHSVLGVASFTNLFRINTALGFETNRYNVKAKLGAQYSEDLTSATEFDVRELTIRGSFGNVDISAGRKILKWSNGYAFSPAGLLDPVRSPSDPQDRLGQLTGRDLVQVDYYRGGDTLTGVFTPGTAAVRYNVLIHGIDLAAIAALNFNAPDKAAVTFSYVFGDRLEVHGEAAGSRGTDALYPQSILPSNQQSLFGPDFLAPLKLDDRRLYLNVLLGVNYTFSNGLNAVVELYHADDGLTATEWAGFLEQGRYSSALATAQSLPPVVDGRSLPELNLLQALQLFQGPGLRRNYLFARFSHPQVGGVELSAIGLLNLDDRSAVLVPEISIPIRHRVVLYALASYFHGDAASEYANVPVAYSATLGIRLHF